MKVNIVILNYEGRMLLEKHLPTICAAAKESAHECCVTVLDNCSKDESVSFVRQNFPGVHVVNTRENKVLCSYNDFAKSVDDDILIFLNNDVSVDRYFVDPLVAVFEEQEDVFFVSTYGDLSLLKFHRGTLTATLLPPHEIERIDELAYTINAGMGAFDRSKFLELGGFDPLYLPGRYEDLDLCYRGWKRGWKGYYQPKSRMMHDGQVSFNRFFSSNQIKRMVFRNSLFFMTKNVTESSLVVYFIFLLILRLVYYAVTFQFHMIHGFVDFLKRLPEVLQAQRTAKPFFKIQDRHIYNLLRRPVFLKNVVSLR